MAGYGVSQELNKVLDQILESRRSIRSFTSEIPSRGLIKEILRAGLLAPYADLALGGQQDFRRFAVIQQGGPMMTRAAEMITRRLKKMVEDLKREMEQKPFLMKKGESFVKRIETISRQGVPGVGSAPYFIVVAERKGFPPVEQQSLAHCLQNMWLKATALGLGVHLVSLTAQMAEDRDFCDMLHIPFGEFELNGFAVGYPEKTLPPASRPSADEVTYWVE